MNTIADELQLTRVLDAAIIGLEAALAPLGLFSYAVSSDPYTPGNNAGNTITVPVYGPASAADVKTRTPGQAYSSKVSDTTTGSRTLTINTEKVVGLGFTNEEAQNQVAFDPHQHGLLKGHALALEVLRDIFSVVRYGNFPNPTLAPMAAANFDTGDVADLAQKAMEASWLQFPVPGLALNPAFHFNLARQSPILDASQSGSTDALRQAKINQIFGFNEVGSNGIPLNNGDAKAMTVVAATDLGTTADHGYLTGDQVVVATDNALPGGLSALTYYYIIRQSASTYKLASSLANAVAGTAIDITSAGTGNHTIQLMTNLVGVAGDSSAIMTGFRPVIPTPGIREKLVSFELVQSANTGLVLEFRHIADEDKALEYQVISVHYGYTFGRPETLKLLSKTL